MSAYRNEDWFAYIITMSKCLVQERVWRSCCDAAISPRWCSLDVKVHNRGASSSLLPLSLLVFYWQTFQGKGVCSKTKFGRAKKILYFVNTASRWLIFNYYFDENDGRFNATLIKVVVYLSIWNRRVFGNWLERVWRDESIFWESRTRRPLLYTHFRTRILFRRGGTQTFNDGCDFTTKGRGWHTLHRRSSTRFHQCCSLQSTKTLHGRFVERTRVYLNKYRWRIYF